VEIYGDFYIHVLLGDIKFIEYVLQQKATLGDKINQFEKALGELQEEHNSKWEKIQRKLVAYGSQLKDIFAQLNTALNSYSDRLSGGKFDLLQTDELNALEKEIEKVTEEYSKIVLDFNYGNPVEKSNTYEVERIKQKLLPPLNISRAIVNTLYYLIRNSKDASLNLLNIFGKASVGKTHLACRIAQEKIEQGLPMILLLGKPFTVAPPLERQLLQILDIPKLFMGNFCSSSAICRQSTPNKNSNSN
jgi:ATP-dependent Clp protease ATP-binding subunit ClpA